MTCLLDIVPILSGEILSKSLVGLKGLRFSKNIKVHDENILF